MCIRDSRAALAAQASPSLPVVDDDPTGTQTVHGVAVRADWADLSGELRSDKSCFYLLANTRALDEAAAVARNREIGRELRRGGPRLVVSRSDSTLRGHFPAEVDALADGLGWRRPLVLVAPRWESLVVASSSSSGMISSTDGAAFFFAGFTAAGAGSVATAGLAFDFFLVELTLVRGMAGRSDDDVHAPRGSRACCAVK